MQHWKFDDQTYYSRLSGDSQDWESQGYIRCISLVDGMIVFDEPFDETWSVYETFGTENSGFVSAWNELIGYIDFSSFTKLGTHVHLLLVRQTMWGHFDIRNPFPITFSRVMQIIKYSIRKTSKWIFTIAKRNIKKGHISLIETVQFVRLCAPELRLVIQFSKPCQLCIWRLVFTYQ